MTTFLAWLYTAASKVYQFFGSAYTSLYNGAANAWNWAVKQAADALNAAKTYAYQLFQSASAVAGITVSWVVQQIQSAINGIREDVIGLFDWVEYRFSTLNAYIGQVIQGWVSNILTFVNDVRNEFNGIVGGITSYLLSWIQSAYGWVIELKEKLLSFLSLLTVDTINELIALLFTWKNTALIFFQNPVVFILDLIQDKVLDFLSYVLAWSLGTTKYDLPKSAPWRK